jgi:hypothetical protein
VAIQIHLIEKDSYLLELARYVVLNPLRAGIIKEIGDWPWSSYPAMIGVVPTPVWLQTDWLLGQFDPQRDRARGKYVDFVRAGVGLPSLWVDLRNQVFLSSEGFVASMHATVSHEQSLDEIPRMQRRLPAKSLASYREEHGDNSRLSMALAYLTGITQ